MVYYIKMKLNCKCSNINVGSVVVLLIETPFYSIHYTIISQKTIIFFFLGKIADGVRSGKPLPNCSRHFNSAPTPSVKPIVCGN